MQTLEVVSEYAQVSKFSKDAYGWLVNPKPEPLPVKRQLSERNKETLDELWEKTDAQISAMRLPDQDFFKDEHRQVGRPMHSSELIRKVLKINPKLVCEDSLNCRGNAAFYYFTPDGVKQPTNAHFKKGILAEFSVVQTDRADLPTKVQYGWREVLLRLVKAKQITLAALLKAFGDTNAVQSKHWRRDAQKFRN